MARLDALNIIIFVAFNKKGKNYNIITSSHNFEILINRRSKLESAKE